MTGTLILLEFGKWTRLGSLRFSLILLVLLPVLWAYAPGIFDVYGVFLVSGYQVPALSLLSGMEFLFPLLVAIMAAELLGADILYGTLRATLLRPVSRAQWLLSKVVIATVMPFLLLAFVLLVSALAGIAYGYGPFTGGTGLGSGGLVGEGTMSAGAAMLEVVRAYGIAAFSLVPVSLLSLLLTVVFMNAAGGALATLGLLIISGLLVVFPAIAGFLPTSLLNSYLLHGSALVTPLILIGVYSIAFAVVAVAVFERKDF